MARPRKTQAGPDAKERMGEAFWQLLEKNELRDITVGMIAAHAHCNRGTFYYHYRDFEDFVSATIEAELFETSILAEGMFRMATDDDFNIFDEISPRLAERISLIIERAGIEIVFKKVHATATLFWNTAVASDEQNLLPEAEAVVDYYIGGVLGIVTAQPGATFRLKLLEGENPVSPVFVTFTRKNCRFLLGEICEIQGVPLDHVLSRLSTINTYLKAARS